MTTPRVRRTPEEARRLILDAAERLLAEGGVAAVHVRAVAAGVGMTDAGLGYHFGTRDRLLEALLHHGGTKVGTGLQQVVESCLVQPADLGGFVETLATFYRQGYGELAIALHAAGWRDPGSGMLNPVVEALHALRPGNGAGIPVDDTRLAVAALHHAVATESAYGSVFRRSAGLTGPDSEDWQPQIRWWTVNLARILDIGDPAPVAGNLSASRAPG
ncbi:TetR/AcrR family transcriptional regulator [Nocardia sp. NPDC058518]|uniref:TetR/AcrR family transcriptional regulator n=1 Tax=Nocardia sp. NPDC058518 TaxID=3346534 RepID=UPI003648CE49